MISRIFNEKLKWFPAVCLLTGILLAIMLGRGAIETGQYYKVGFYALLCLCGCLTMFALYLVRKRMPLDSSLLEKEIQALKKELVQAEKERDLGILADSVAHDLNNLLSGLDTYPEVMMMGRDMDPKLEQGLEIIRDCGRKSSAVVKDLLTISRGSDAVKEILNMNQVIERFIHARDFEKIRKNHADISVKVIREPELLNIKASYVHMEKIIANLLCYAIEETSGKKRPEVIVQTANAYIDAPSEDFHDLPEGEYIRLRVADNGPAIPGEHLGSIFDPYYTKKKMGKRGTGLGMSVVWHAVRDHGGWIKTESDKNGTRFDLLFSATREKIPEQSQNESIDEIAGAGETILVVDHLGDQQKIAVGILIQLGYKARAVYDGDAAVEFVKNHHADLVILDVVMPDSMSWFETLRKIRKIIPDQKAVIAGREEMPETTVEVVPGSFIKKPYTKLDMGIAVKEELEK